LGGANYSGCVSRRQVRGFVGYGRVRSVHHRRQRCAERALRSIAPVFCCGSTAKNFVFTTLEKSHLYAQLLYEFKDKPHD
jgi:hypothetical protein